MNKYQKIQKELHHVCNERLVANIWAHRRFGKTTFALNHLIKAARKSREPKSFLYMGYDYQFAKTVVKPMLRPWYHFGGSNGVPFFEVKNSRVYLCGADSPELIKGLMFDGVVMDEVRNPIIFGEVVYPSVIDKKGFVVIIGSGHTAFHCARKDLIRFSAEDTGILSPEDLKLARKSMPYEEYSQDYLCRIALLWDNEAEYGMKLCLKRL